MIEDLLDYESEILEEKIECGADNLVVKKIKDYFINIKNENGLTIMETDSSFPSKQDCKFISEAELDMVLDYSYDILEKFFIDRNKTNKNSEVVTVDIQIVLSILNKLSKNNIPKSFSAGMLYYQIKHCYNLGLDG
jgi:hypothetical protein